MFGMTAPTPFDLHFHVLNIPVRVSVWFWVGAAMFAPVKEGRAIILWIFCVLLSLLAHEMGHALVSRLFRCAPSIVLLFMCGLCDSQAERQTPWQRLAVLCGGPGAGFLFAAAIWFGAPALTLRLSDTGVEILQYLLLINLFWSIFNLAPVIPLDGGQIVAVVLSMFSPRNGVRWAHVVSLIAAILLAAYFFSSQNLWSAVLFSVFAISNYQALHSYYQHARNADDVDDWWRH